MAGAASIVLTQMPDRAPALARSLVEASLAGPVESLYHWRGKIEMAQEVAVSLQTSDARYAEVEAAIRARHPYELLEIVAVPVTDGLAFCLQWTADETDTS